MKLFSLRIFRLHPLCFDFYIDDHLARIDIVACPACGQPKLSHHLCHACYGHMARSKKEELGYVEPQREEPQIEKAEEPRRDTPIPDLPEPQEHPQSAPTWERREKGLLSGALSPLTKWWRK